MAHSDVLIFLTNITWVFVLFLFVYFFFVLFFLPTLYKKFRMRVLLHRVNSLAGVLAIRDVLVSLTFFIDYFRGLGAVATNFILSGIFFFELTRSILYSFVGATTTTAALANNSLFPLLGGLAAEFLADGSAACVKILKN